MGIGDLGGVCGELGLGFVGFRAGGLDFGREEDEVDVVVVEVVGPLGSDLLGCQVTFVDQEEHNFVGVHF